MVTKGAKALVIAAIDGTTLSDVLKQAKAAGITVIAYDRLIRDTPNVDYYATFDNFQVGVLQAQSIEQGLGLKDGKGPFNIELFGGSPDDNNAYFFYNGAMSVLQPYIDSHKLTVVSGQDAEVPSIKAMLRGEQYATIFKDTRDLAKVAADMVDAALDGKQVTVNDTKTYNNGVKVVPSYLLKPVVVYKGNWEKVLIDSGYYKRSQFE